MSQPTGTQLTSTDTLNRIVETAERAHNINPSNALAELHSRAVAENALIPHVEMMRQALANMTLDQVADVEQFNRHFAHDADEPVIIRENAAWMRALAMDDLHRRAVVEDVEREAAALDLLDTETLLRMAQQAERAIWAHPLNDGRAITPERCAWSVRLFDDIAAVAWALNRRRTADLVGAWPAVGHGHRL